MVWVNHIIKMTKFDTIRFLKDSKYFDPEEVNVLIIAPTGIPTTETLNIITKNKLMFYHLKTRR